MKWFSAILDSFRENYLLQSWNTDDGDDNHGDEFTRENECKNNQLCAVLSVIAFFETQAACYQSIYVFSKKFITCCLTLMTWKFKMVLGQELTTKLISYKDAQLQYLKKLYTR